MKTKTKTIAIGLLTIIPLAAMHANSAIAITNIGASYTQNFTDQTPGVMPAGWTLNPINGSWAWRNDVDDGTSNAGGTRFYGMGGNSAALGFLANATMDGGAASIGTWDVAAIASFANNTGGPLAGFSVGYTGQQWRVGGFSGDGPGRDSGLGVFYRIDGGAWTEVSELAFTAPNPGATGGELNPPAFADLFATINTVVPASSVLEIAWQYDGTLTGGFGSRQGLGITNVEVTAIPEPSTYAAIFGALALLGVVVYRRRRS